MFGQVVQNFDLLKSKFYTVNLFYKLKIKYVINSLMGEEGRVKHLSFKESDQRFGDISESGLRSFL